jgi:hypothetical protein
MLSELISVGSKLIDKLIPLVDMRDELVNYPKENLSKYSQKQAKRFAQYPPLRI